MHFQVLSLARTNTNMFFFLMNFYLFMFLLLCCRDENTLLNVFQLHVLSLEVLREAVYP